jgi:hypothetical protein
MTVIDDERLAIVEREASARQLAQRCPLGQKTRSCLVPSGLRVVTLRRQVNSVFDEFGQAGNPRPEIA